MAFDQSEHALRLSNHIIANQNLFLTSQYQSHLFLAQKGSKKEVERKTLKAQERTNKQLYSHYAKYWNRTWVTLVRGEYSDHCATRASIRILGGILLNW